jgi:oxygen-independent coproporphyrinogen-3 oxidase
VKDLVSYRARLEAGLIPVAKGYELTAEDKLRADVIMRLMCDMALDFDAMGEKWSIDFRNHFAAALEQLKVFVEDDLLKWTDAGCRVTDHGRLFIRNLAMCFDAYLEPSSETRYSRTV